MQLKTQAEPMRLIRKTVADKLLTYAEKTFPPENLMKVFSKAGYVD